MRYLFLVLLLTGCASQQSLKKDFFDSEQARVSSYYCGHVSFRPSFYDQSDSIWHSITGNDTSVVSGLYSRIRITRTKDSLNAYSSNFYTRKCDELNSIISAAKAGR